MNSNQDRLSAAFTVKAKLNCGTDDLKHHLKQMSSLELIKNEEYEQLRYRFISKNKSRKNESLLALSSSSISLIFFFEKQSRFIYKNNLVLFVASIAFLKDLYIVEFGDIYPYFIESLQNDWELTIKSDSRTIDVLKERIKTIAESNSILSFQIIKLSKENAILSSDISVYKNLCLKVVSSVKEHRSRGFDLLKALEIEPEIIEKAKNRLEISV